MTKKRILIAEDEDSIRNLVKYNLEAEGHSVTTAENGLEAMKRFKEGRYDLAILDIMMPEIDGYSVCESIRLVDTHIPVLFLSAKSSGESRVKGLKLGADDFLSKPFHLEELIIRVNRLLSKHTQEDVKPSLIEYSFGDKNYINFGKYEAIGVNGPFKLTKKEALLLKLLIEYKGEVVSREKILTTVWGYSVFPATRTIDNFILSFRKYFEPDPKNAQYFISLRGVGYKFVIPE
jgi:two-component system alkaline phosphatase synthesis response regulator PhoP